MKTEKPYNIKFKAAKLSKSGSAEFAEKQDDFNLEFVKGLLREEFKKEGAEQWEKDCLEAAFIEAKAEMKQERAAV